MKIKAILASLLASVAIHGATAGDWCAPSTDAKCPVECAPEPLGFTFDYGYDSAYYFRGLWFSNNNLWSSLVYSKPIADNWTWTMGAYYTASENTQIRTLAGDLEYSELDVFTNVSYDAEWAKFTLGYTNYNFFDTFSGSVNGATNGFPGMRDSQVRDSRDVSLLMSVPLGKANVYALYAYDFRIAGQYAEFGGDYTHALTDCISLVPSIQVGYNVNNYYTYYAAAVPPGVFGAPQSAWNHIRPMLAAPIKITKNVSFVPYVAYNWSLDARKLLNGPVPGVGIHDFYGGARLSITF